MEPSLLGPIAVRAFIRRALFGSHASSTGRAYESDLRYFSQWMRTAVGCEMSLPVPSTILVQFIEEHGSGLSPSVIGRSCRDGSPRQHSFRTIARRLLVIRMVHRAEGLQDPVDTLEVREAVRRAQRLAARNPRSRHKAITRDVLEAMLATCPQTLKGVRDRAMLLLAFSSGGRRRSEVVGIAFTDLAIVPEGYLLTIRKSKTDQNGLGHVVPIVGRAAEALREWLDVSKIRDGALFRIIRTDGSLSARLNDRTFSRVVKRHIALAGYDPVEFSAHSLRAGFITESARQRISLGDAMALSGHKTVSVALRYYRAGSVLQNPAARLVD